MGTTTSSDRTLARELADARALLDGRPVTGPLSGPVAHRPGGTAQDLVDVLDVLDDARGRLGALVALTGHVGAQPGPPPEDDERTGGRPVACASLTLC